MQRSSLSSWQEVRGLQGDLYDNFHLYEYVTQRLRYIVFILQMQ